MPEKNQDERSAPRYSTSDLTQIVVELDWDRDGVKVVDGVYLRFAADGPAYHGPR
jgi:hypothetical protein